MLVEARLRIDIPRRSSMVLWIAPRTCWDTRKPETTAFLARQHPISLKSGFLDPRRKRRERRSPCQENWSIRMMGGIPPLQVPATPIQLRLAFPNMTDRPLPQTPPFPLPCVESGSAQCVVVKRRDQSITHHTPSTRLQAHDLESWR